MRQWSGIAGSCCGQELWVKEGWALCLRRAFVVLPPMLHCMG